MIITKNQIYKICKIAWEAGEKVLDIYSKKIKVYKSQFRSLKFSMSKSKEKVLIKLITIANKRKR